MTKVWVWALPFPLVFLKIARQQLPDMNHIPYMMCHKPQNVTQMQFLQLHVCKPIV